MASIFTTSGAAARKFRYEVPAGNIGINIGVAAPMAYFPFSGWTRQLFRRAAWPGPGRRRVLHRQENRGGTLAEAVVAEVLILVADGLKTDSERSQVLKSIVVHKGRCISCVTEK